MLSVSGSLSSQSYSGDDFVSQQLSFSTADVEGFVFYGVRRPTPALSVERVSGTPGALEGPEPTYKAMVVNGELYGLEENAEVPGMQTAPLAEDAGILRIIGLNEQTARAG